jgi:hypothetical protein
MTKINFKVEDIISHKSTGTQYRIKEFGLETVSLKNVDPNGRFQNRKITKEALQSGYKVSTTNTLNPDILDRVTRIEAAVKFMREDITAIKDMVSTMHGNLKRTSESLHGKVHSIDSNVELLLDTLNEELGVKVE